jgi:hypothetical protein
MGGCRMAGFLIEGCPIEAVTKDSIPPIGKIIPQEFEQ